MTTEAQYLAEFNNIRNQNFWNGWSSEQLRTIAAISLIGDTVKSTLSATRERATSIAQTINAQGSVTSVVYTFADGSTVTDTFIYGSNSTTEPTSITRGTLVPAGLPTTLSNFGISANGLTITYSSTVPVTALTGTIFVGGASRVLTHISSGAALISGAAILQSASGITVNLTSTNPLLVVAVTNATVTNNSTVVTSALTKQTITWSSTSGVTASGDIVTLAASGSCGVASYGINSALPFAVRGSITPSGLAQVLVNLDTNNNPIPGYGGTTPFIFGHSIYDLVLYTHLGGSTAGQQTGRGAVTSPFFYEYSSAGDGTVTLNKSSDGITYTAVTSATGVTGTIYVKAIQANLTNSTVNVQIFA